MAEARVVETLAGTVLIADVAGALRDVAAEAVRCAVDGAECAGADDPTPEWPVSPGAADATAPSHAEAMKNPAPTATASAPT